MLPTKALSAVTASILVKTFHPDDVDLDVRGAWPGSCGCTSSRSNSASNAPAGTPPERTESSILVLVMVQLVLFWSDLKAMNLNLVRKRAVREIQRYLPPEKLNAIPGQTKFRVDLAIGVCPQL